MNERTNKQTFFEGPPTVIKHSSDILVQREVLTLTLPMYSESRSCRAWRTALHSATMRSRRSSRVQDESAIRAAPLIMLSRRSSSEGLKRSSLKLKGSTMICFYRESVTDINTHFCSLSHSKGKESIDQGYQDIIPTPKNRSS